MAMAGFPARGVQRLSRTVPRRASVCVRRRAAGWAVGVGALSALLGFVFVYEVF
jgi:hypothetical protein